MAGKQATLFVIDVGETTAIHNHGRNESDLNYGMRFIWSKIADILAASSGSHLVGVLCVRTDDSNAEVDDAEEGEFDNIYELREMSPITLSDLKSLRQQIKPSKTHNGDVVSAINYGFDLMNKATLLKSGKPGAYARKVIVLTDGRGPIENYNDHDGKGENGSDVKMEDINDSEIGIKSVAEGCATLDIELQIIGIDFDDEEYGFMEEHKPTVKRNNEGILKKLIELCGERGLFATAKEAIENISVPKVKISRPYASYKGILRLGDNIKYPDTAMAIDVERYFRTKIAPAPSASSFVARARTTEGDVDMQDADVGDMERPGVKTSAVQEAMDLEPVKTTREYLFRNSDGQSESINREDLAKGYEYGRTVVPMTESDEAVTTFESEEGFEILGFIAANKFDRFLAMGESNITIAARTNEKAVMALSSLVWALEELESYAIARLVAKKDKPPQLLLLAPLIETGLEALIDIPLPFAEDVRAYKFPPLDKILTSSGAILKQHRDLPTKELTNAMSLYVDSMDLSTLGDLDAEGNPEGYMPIEETYSPTLHRINQAIKLRAIKPNDAIEPPAEILMRFSHPPEDLVAAAAKQLKNLIKIANVKRVEAKPKGAKRERELPRSGLDIDALLAPTERRPPKISQDNPIGDFKKQFRDIPADTDIKALAVKACKELGALIHKDIKASLEPNDFERAYAKIGVMRDEMLDLEEPEIFNGFMQELKRKLFSEELTDDYRVFFYGIGTKKLGLISLDEDEHHAKITSKEARKFLSRMSLEDN